MQRVTIKKRILAERVKVKKPSLDFGPMTLTVFFAILAAVALIFVLSTHHANKSSAASKFAATPTKSIQKSVVHVSALEGATGPADELLPLGQAIGNYLDNESPGSSVYIEGLFSNLAVHVGETKAYNTKSLMKVPLVMSMYKAGALSRLNLDQKIAIAPNEIDNTFGNLWQKKAGYQITLREAAQYALRSSDNTAIRFINDHVNPVMPKNERAYKVINLDAKVDSNGDSYITTASYSAVFRCLYESCYNSTADSNEMLSLMKQSDFTAPKTELPAGVEVAHKIGNVGNEGYNDCGIVYGAKSPFMFCIMLASGEPDADREISWITKHAYDFFEK